MGHGLRGAVRSYCSIRGGPVTPVSFIEGAGAVGGGILGDDEAAGRRTAASR
jgi:hypothetical protein